MLAHFFEPDARLHQSWLDTMKAKIDAENSDFVIIHMQETGGKKFAECSKQVPVLIERLRESLPQFSTMRAYADLEYESIEYTALGMVVFIRSSLLPNVYQFNFASHNYEPVKATGELVMSGLEKHKFIVKQKFPKHFWPAIKWGRKGYMQTRWKIKNKVFDFVNAHLFHDESNLALIHENPQLYSQNRKRALDFVLEELANLENGSAPLHFIFGDLNFRLDASSFLNKLTVRAAAHSLNDQEQTGSIGEGLEAPNNNLSPHPDLLRRTVSAIEFRRPSATEAIDGCVLRIEKKRFDYFNHAKLLDDWKSYLEDDKEATNFKQLHEIPINFPPTYPWSEDPEDSEALMKTRAPAWCDRVLMNNAAFEFIRGGGPTYESFGRETCTGDHKPVALSFSTRRPL
ncbi:unnamed protein product [Caenorhabditis auriculariae]|uniref:inositol-polyphosphate 5-phosphatase n=1 Tax=Caenorhabditis auriculariae TaxID=2777116 RepID=A0A8S1H598_9PELO|nr:unnamed protein product [Caenorhabditis auriculariae]